MEAGVPLIASQNSGLFKLLEKDEALGDAAIALFKHLDVRGSGTSETDKNYRTEDKEDVRSALLELARDTKKARKNALKLRKMLKDKGFTWLGAASEFLKNLGGVDVESPNLKQGATPANPEDKPKAPLPSEDAKIRTQTLITQLTLLFNLEELKGIIDTFLQSHYKSHPDLKIDRGNLAEYLLSLEDEDSRYQNVAELLGLILDHGGSQVSQSSHYKLFALLLQTLVRRCVDEKDQGLTHLPFLKLQTAELVAANRTLSPHVPSYSAEHVNGKRDKHWTNVGKFIPEDGSLSIDEKCQRIAAGLVAEWFENLTLPNNLPADRAIKWLADLLEPFQHRDPANRPFHGLYVSSDDTSNPVNISEIARKLHETFKNLLWIYQYGEQHEHDLESQWLYTSEAKIVSWISQHESTSLKS
jgi:hypothetical protein